jgi:hypothetical protein
MRDVCAGKEVVATKLLFTIFMSFKKRDSGRWDVNTSSN